MRRRQFVPPSDLLEQVAGIEETLQKNRRLGAVGWTAAVVAAIQLGLAAASGVQRIQLPAGWTQYLIASAVAFAVLAFVLRQWLRFWIHESRRSFRYMYSVGDFTRLGETQGIDLSWLSVDISLRLSQRISRLSRVKEDAEGKKGRAAATRSPDDLAEESRVHVEGTWGVRRRRDGVWQIVVTPWIRVGPPGSPMSLAHPVTFPAQPTEAETAKPERLRPEHYDKLLERVYFSIASEIYKQIRTNVERRIKLLPWRSFRAAAYFQEAEDYLRSNTLDAYQDARDLYLQVIRTYDPIWIRRPMSSWRRLLLWTRRAWAAVRWRLTSTLSHVSRRLGGSELMVARAYIGYANALVYSRILAGLSGQRINPIFEARLAVENAIQHLERLPDHVRGRREAYFEALVTAALVMAELRSPNQADGFLADARSREPIRKESDASYLFVRGYLEAAPQSSILFLRRAVEANPDYEIAQFALARAIEMEWRSRPRFDPEVARTRVIAEYDRVVDLNPANIAAWANMGYICWLLAGQSNSGRPDWITDAKRYYERGREYKEIKRATFVSHLDYGLARIAAESGKFEVAYPHYLDAASAKTASGVAHEAYTGDQTFAGAGPALVQRFERYRDTVRQRVATSRRVSPLVRDTVRLFADNDYGEACHAAYLQTADQWCRDRASATFEELCQPPLGDISVIPHLNRHRLLAQDSEYWGDAVLTVVRREPYWTEGNLELLLFRGRRRRALRREMRRMACDARLHFRDAYALRGLRAGGLAGGEEPAALPTLTPLSESAPVTSRTTDRGEADLGRHEALYRRARMEIKRARFLRTALTDLDQEADRAIRALLPHGWLWADEDRSGGPAFHRTLRKASYAHEFRWEREFDDYHVEALRAWAAGRKPGNRVTILEHVRDHHWPEDFDMLVDLRNAQEEATPRAADRMAVHTDVEVQLQRLLNRWPIARLEFSQLQDLHRDGGPWVCCSQHASELLERVAQVSRSPAMSIWAGDRLLEAGRAQTAVEAWQHAIEHLRLAGADRPDRLDLLIAAASGLTKADRWAAALAAAELTCRRAGDGATRLDARMLMARCQWVLGRQDRAIETLSRVPRDEPELLWRCGFIESLPERAIASARAAGVWRLRDWLEAEIRREGPGRTATGDAVEAVLLLRRRRSPARPAEGPGGEAGRAPDLVRLVVDAHPGFFPDAAGPLLAGDGLPRLWTRVRKETGVELPAVRVRASEDLSEGWFRILLDDVPVRTHRVEGPQAPDDAVLAALDEMVRTVLDRFVGTQEASNLVDQWRTGARDDLRQRVDAALQEAGGPGRLVAVLQHLLRERVSITDLSPILEVFVSPRRAARPEAVAEMARGRLDPSRLGITAGVRLLRLTEEFERTVAARRHVGELERAVHEAARDVPAALVVFDTARRPAIQRLVLGRLPNVRVVTLRDVLRSGIPRPLAFTTVHAYLPAAVR